ncbi:MAG TPA: HEAT repeat domain-containing protein [Thermoanaerobaculia bacterium]|jgi:HEAT repeat protein|nr:HEAT repeat domain-containing protein [Thermoanaerobaculia bacterium]
MTGMQSPFKQAPSWDECVQLLERLPSLPLDSRVEAIERLVRNPSPGIREQALRIGAAILPDSRLSEYLRDDSDAVLRNAGSEIFRLRGGRSLPVVIGLLQDPDPDVVLQSVLILEKLRDPRALEPLHAALGHPDPNVQQEAILAVGGLGDARSIPHLLPFLDADPWVQMAAVQALGDLRSAEAIPHLAPRLRDPVVGSLAAEALARIGGEPSFRALVACWPAGGVEIEEEAMLGLLAHVLEGLPKSPAELPEGFLEALSVRLSGPSAEVREAAARCLLVLGPSGWDDESLTALAGSPPPTGVLPPALARRGDLVGRLLTLPDEERSWGLLLAARFPAAVPEQVLLRALEEIGDEPELLPPLAQALERLHFPGLGMALLDLYLRLDNEGRELLVPVFEIHGAALTAALARRPEVSAVDRLALSALLGRPADEVVAEIVHLAPPHRPELVGRLMGIEPVVRRLPWGAWLEEAPELFGVLAAEAAGRYEIRELLPILRERVKGDPSAAGVRVLGELADREAVPVLLDLLAEAGSLRAAVLESLGRIGGPEARQALRDAVRSGRMGPEARIAYRALAVCAGPGDEALLRDAALHPDWYVRLAAVDGLTRFEHPEKFVLLARLAADPVPAVAHRALSRLAD